MADELAPQVAAAAPAAVSSPLSSPAPAPSAPAASPAPTAASAPIPASPDGTPSPAPSEAPARPDGIPDNYWDAEKNALKVDPEALARDLKERDELKTFKAAEEIKAASRPKTPDEYKLELPADFKPPAGVDYKLDAANPALGQLRAVAHKHGLSQDAVKELLGVYAGHEVGTQAAINAARAAEIAKLGTSAPARVDSVVNWLSGMDTSPDKGDAKALAGMIVTARHVEAFERIITRLTSQGAASFSQQHRTAPDSNTIPGYETMTFEQRRFAQDQKNAARRTG